MQRQLLNGKIHRARVSAASLDYIGSITVDKTLMDAADFKAYELVHVVNITNGNRIQTYVIEGEPGSGTIQLNGAAAHLFDIDDIVIIMSYVTVTESAKIESWEPKVVFVDANNKQVNKQQLEANQLAEKTYTRCA